MEADGSRKATFGPWVADETKQNWYFVNTLGKFFQIAFEMDQKQTKQVSIFILENVIKTNLDGQLDHRTRSNGGLLTGTSR